MEVVPPDALVVAQPLDHIGDVRADLLAERAVPFVFATGYDEGAIPSRFADRPRCEKPIDMAKIKQAIGCVIHA